MSDVWTEDMEKWLGMHHKTRWNRTIRAARDEDKKKTKDWDTADNPTAKKYMEVSDSVAQLYIDAKARFDDDKHVRQEAFDTKMIDKKAYEHWRAYADKDRVDIKDAVVEMYKTLGGVSKNIEKIANAKADDPNKKNLADKCEPAFADLKVQLRHGRAILERNKNRADLNIAKINPDLDSEYADKYAGIQSRKEKLRIQLQDLRAIFPKLFDDHEADAKADVKEGLLTDKEAVKSLKKAAETKKEFELTAVELSMALYDVEKKAKGIVEAHAKGRKPDKETLIKECDIALDDTKGRLDEIEKRIANYFNGKADVLAKKFGALAKLSGGEVQRSGTDVTGTGTAKLRTRAKNVPPAVIEPIAAKIDVIRLLGQTGDLGEKEFLAMQEFQKEVEKDIADTMDNLVAYKEISDKTRSIEKKLADEDFMCASDSYEKLTRKLNEEKDKSGSAITAKLLKEHKENLDKLETEVDDALGFIKGNAKTFKEIQKMHDETRKKSLKKYSDAFGDVVKAYRKTSAGKKDDAIKKLAHSAETDYQGKYATDFSDIWSKVSMGDYVTAETAKFATIALEEEIDKVVKDLKESCAGASKWDTSLDSKLSVALEDIGNSDKEIEARKKAEEDFEKKHKELKKYIKSEIKTLDKVARNEFKNHEILLHILHDRSKQIAKSGNSGDWRKILNELNSRDVEIHRYAAANLNDDETVTGQIESIFKNCGRRIEYFRTDLEKFYDTSVTAEMKELEVIIKSGGTEMKKAQEVLELIKNKKTALKTFTDAIRKIMAGADDSLNRLYKNEFQSASTTELKIKVREKALAVIRRRRLFLEETKLGRDYRRNPFDSGTPLTLMIKALTAAEVRLLTEIKRK